ncbi:hypothetical protein AB0M95_38800 [Sphaerisporangium sp. NPDC051017]|uniref:hypothetical protein n=1 Tax=Sphaerisporangium sp. NPDC051017 TaxID=3154636 RepID=UPI00342E0F79
MRLTTYNGHHLVTAPDSATTTGWWYVPDCRLHVKMHDRWRAEVWHDPDRLHTALLRIYDHARGTVWLETSYTCGIPGAVPFERADQFMLEGRMPGWGEWPTEPTSSGRVPMATCVYCRGPVSHADLLVIGSGPALSSVYRELAAWAPRAHRSCHQDHRRRQGPCDAPGTAPPTATQGNSL